MTSSSDNGSGEVQHKDAAETSMCSAQLDQLQLNSSRSLSENTNPTVQMEDIKCPAPYQHEQNDSRMTQGGQGF